MHSRCVRHAMLDFSLQWRELRGCRSVELRALCNEVPRTPPGPEGSNGTGNASGAADHPKFLAPGKFLIAGCHGSARGATLSTYGLPSHRTKISPANISGSCRTRAC